MTAVFITATGTVAVLRADARIPIRPALVATNGDLHDLAPQLVPADYPASKLLIPQQVILSAADGMKIHGQLFLPATANDGNRHPALVFFHGGSRREMLLGYHYMDYYSNAYAMNQYLASLGYIVLSVNYRSGIGYGLNFREAINYGASGASDRVQRPRRFQARDDARGIGDVDANVARLRSSGHDVMARRKLRHDRAPQHSACADEENAKTLRLRHQLALPLNSMGAWRGARIRGYGPGLRSVETKSMRLPIAILMSMRCQPQLLRSRPSTTRLPGRVAGQAPGASGELIETER